MWGTFLSEPLLIVALVGRRPANQLIRRIPVRHRKKLYFTSAAVSEGHAVLVCLSAGYPAVTGRLDTRYSPVRRSTSEECEHSTPFPLDLHVLSL